MAVELSRFTQLIVCPGQRNEVAMGRVEVGISPLVNAVLDIIRVHDRFVCQDTFQHGHPEPVVGVTRVCFFLSTVIAVAFLFVTHRGDFRGQCFGPLAPRKAPSLVKSDNQRKDLRLPRVGEHRLVAITRQPGQVGRVRVRTGAHTLSK